MSEREAYTYCTADEAPRPINARTFDALRRSVRTPKRVEIRVGDIGLFKKHLVAEYSVVDLSVQSDAQAPTLFGAPAIEDERLPAHGYAVYEDGVLARIGTLKL